jgi:hypothetical protein
MFSTDLSRTLRVTESLQHNLGLELGAEIPSLAHLALLLLHSVPCLVPLSMFWDALHSVPWQEAKAYLQGYLTGYQLAPRMIRTVAP